jgi:hypothetical protein
MKHLIDKEIPNVIKDGVIYESDTHLSFVCPCGCGIQIMKEKPFDLTDYFKDQHFEP